MKLLLIVSLFYSLLGLSNEGRESTRNLTPITNLSGEILINIRPTDLAPFRTLFSNHVQETVGRGPSPVITARDVLEALQFFADPNLALQVLEETKGEGGALVFNFDYESPRPDSTTPISSFGDLTYGCHIMRDDQNPQFIDSHFPRENSYTSSYSPNNYLTGKWYQFKWASRNERLRLIADCLKVILPTLPELIPLSFNEEPELHSNFSFSQELINTTNRYLSFRAEEIIQISENPEKIDNFQSCLTEEMIDHQQLRAGSNLVFQRIPKRRYELGELFLDSPENTLPTPRQEFLNQNTDDHPFVFGVAIVDDETFGRMRPHLDNRNLVTTGIWTNHIGVSLDSVLAQILGAEMDAVLSACLMDAGIVIPNINEFLPTFYNNQTCRQQDLVDITLEEVLEIQCEGGNGLSCFLRGKQLQMSAQLDCLPNSYPSPCLRENTNSIMNFSSAQNYFNLSCQHDYRLGCLEMLTRSVGNIIRNETNLTILRQVCVDEPSLINGNDCRFYLENLWPLNSQSRNFDRISDYCENLPRKNWNNISEADCRRFQIYQELNP